jgi:hypothetical protein
MSIQITREQFEALRPISLGQIEHEVDGKYRYETFLDEDGNEIAFSSTSTEAYNEVDEKDDYLSQITTYTLISHD